jgi:hypothetical protein
MAINANYIFVAPNSKTLTSSGLDASALMKFEGASAFYDPGTNDVFLSSKYSITSLIHEALHIQYYVVGEGTYGLGLSDIEVAKAAGLGDFATNEAASAAFSEDIRKHCR